MARSESMMEVVQLLKQQLEQAKQEAASREQALRQEAASREEALRQEIAEDRLRNIREREVFLQHLADIPAHALAPGTAFPDFSAFDSASELWKDYWAHFLAY